ncbi:unnamed protein product [Urochloa humidicola]
MAAMSSVPPPAVRVLAAYRVVPALAQDPGRVNSKVKLSFLDAQLITRSPVQQVFLYELSSAAEFPAAVQRLRESLAAALAIFLPLAGRLVYAGDTGDVVVDCSDPGVAFFEAEVVVAADGGRAMDVRRLAGDDATHHVPYLQSLMPEFEARALPSPVLAVQATWLGGAGCMALSTCLHHAVIDGRSLWRFIDMWASASRRSMSTSTTRVGVAKPLGELCYGREAVAAAHPAGDELAREILKKVAPNLPVLRPSGTTRRLPGMAWRRFFLGAGDIGSLKRTIDRLALASPLKPTTATSTFVAVTALCWTSLVRCRPLAPGHAVHLAFPVDLRARLRLRRPPAGGGYIGVCIKKCLASADAGELVGDAGILRAAQAIQEAVREAGSAPLVGTEAAWSERVARVPAGQLAVVAGCPMSYRLYETADYGFGKPVLADDVPLDYDGRMLLSAGRRHGEVQISVSLHQACMDAFAKHINEGQPRARI